MNRSMVKRALKLSRAGYSRAIGADGDVTFVAVFPRGAFGSDVPEGFRPDAVEPTLKGLIPPDMIPVDRGLWWSPDDPQEPTRSGTALVALAGWDAEPEHGIEAQSDEVWIAHCDYERSEDPNISTLWDKPHRIRWTGERAFVTQDPAIFRAATLLFNVIEEGNGFLPNLEGGVWGDYSGRWYLNVEYRPDDCDDDVLYDLIAFMDGLRRDFRAQIRLYGTTVKRVAAPSGRPWTTLRSNAPDGLHCARSAEHFAKAMKAWPHDRETWEVHRHIH